MNTINLLPKEERQNLSNKKREKLSVVLGMILVISLVAFAMVLLALKFYILQELVVQQSILSDAQHQNEDPSISSYTALIKKYNNDLAKADTFYKNQSYTSSILQTMLSINPANSISIADLSMKKADDNTGFNITISGTADTRDNLILFKDALGENNKIKNVYFSPDSWIKPDNVNFYLTLEVLK